MELTDRIWTTAEGGYRIPYNASKSLRKLKESESSDEMKAPFEDLWENLHHQGDVGLASYLAVPQLVEICIDMKSLDLNFISLCLTIEHCRLNDGNPELPAEYQDLYLGALVSFEKYLLTNFKNIHDQTALRLSLALFATLNGQPNLGKVIEGER